MDDNFGKPGRPGSEGDPHAIGPKHDDPTTGSDSLPDDSGGPGGSDGQVEPGSFTRPGGDGDPYAIGPKHDDPTTGPDSLPDDSGGPGGSGDEDEPGSFSPPGGDGDPYAIGPKHDDPTTGPDSMPDDSGGPGAPSSSGRPGGLGGPTRLLLFGGAALLIACLALVVLAPGIFRSIFPVVSKCGNDVCDPGETSSTCPADCPITPIFPVDTCGNKVCDPGENASTCPEDCAPTFTPAPKPAGGSPASTSAPAQCAAGWLPQSRCTCCGTTLTCADGTVAQFNPACGVGGGGNTCQCQCGPNGQNCFNTCTQQACVP